MTTLLVRVLRDLDNGVALAAFAPDPAMPPSISSFAFAAGVLGGKIKNLLARLVIAEPSHWGIAFRHLEGEGVVERLQWPPSPWQVLPDDGRRYYADPFVIMRDGQTHLFVEEFPYATGKGLISHCVIDSNGKTSTPKPVLETGLHMSYPFVFERDGETFMIPETGAARKIELYRAQRFPDRWTLDCVLVDDVEAYDATLVEHDGRFWMFAALAEEGGSTSDALGLFYAENLRGPWHAHSRNPVLIDARSARPGGAIVARNGQLLRIAQDCSESYGGAMAIWRVDKLDPQNYEQSLLTHLRPPPGLHATGTHTLNRCAGVEVIDFKRPLRRAAVRRLPPADTDGLAAALGGQSLPRSPTREKSGIPYGW